MEQKIIQGIFLLGIVCLLIAFVRTFYTKRRDLKMENPPAPPEDQIKISDLTYIEIVELQKFYKERYITLTTKQKDERLGKYLRQEVFKIGKKLREIDETLGFKTTPSGSYKPKKIKRIRIGKHEEERE